jgi:hypothetical protein
MTFAGEYNADFGDDFDRPRRSGVGVWVDDVRVANVVAPVVLTHGRTSPTSSPESPTCTYTVAAPASPPALGAVVYVVAANSDVRFVGRVTDTATDAAGRVDVIAAGLQADLGRVVDASPPRPHAEPLRWRWWRVMVDSESAGAVRPNGWAILGLGDPLYDSPVAATDSDRATFADTVAELAGRTGSIVWQARNGDLVVELPEHRSRPPTVSPVSIPAAAISAVGFARRQSPAGVVNDATVEWADYATGDEVFRSETVIDAASVDQYGRRHVGLQSLWTRPVDARSHAGRIVERWRRPWHDIGALNIAGGRLSPAEYADVLDALAPSTWIVLPVDPTGVVGSSSVWLVEGITESWSGVGADWSVTVSPAARDHWRRWVWRDWSALTWSTVKQRSWVQRLESAP